MALPHSTGCCDARLGAHKGATGTCKENPLPVALKVCPTRIVGHPYFPFAANCHVVETKYSRGGERSQNPAALTPWKPLKFNG